MAIFSVKFRHLEHFISYRAWVWRDNLATALSWRRRPRPKLASTMSSMTSLGTWRMWLFSWRHLSLNCLQYLPPLCQRVNNMYTKFLLCFAILLIFLAEFYCQTSILYVWISFEFMGGSRWIHLWIQTFLSDPDPNFSSPDPDPTW